LAGTGPAPEAPAPESTVEEAASPVAPDPTPAKRRFWSKLNIFKKKSVESAEKQ
jgi:hypothetical protein